MGENQAGYAGPGAMALTARARVGALDLPPGGIAPLGFNGTADSVYHPYDWNGRRHMEFLHEHGEFEGFPHELAVKGIRAAHARLFEGRHGLAGGSPAAGARPAPCRP
jgi:hypothetical protein